MTKTLIFTAGLLAFSTGIACAQTPLAGPPGAANAQAKVTASFQTANAAGPRGVTKDMLQQAAQQRQGNYGNMVRPTAAGGQIQSAWDKAGSKGGIHSQVECGECIYKVRLREFMVTAIQLPADVVVTDADLGDGSRFEVQKRSANTLVVKPLGSGVDTSLQVYTKSGEVFSFYLRAEGFNSRKVPDLSFKITRKRKPQGAHVNFSSSATPLPMTGFGAPAKPVSGPKDFVKNAKYDPARLRGWGDYKLWGSKELKPENVFRDDYFTYIQFGDKWTDIELPTAYVVVDGIDELVNTRVSGTTYIIESTHKLITLKSGQSFMCIQYKGE
ncbi:TrbG/VirB9 family P-type conjugative transfer protein [Polycladidibacter hongkongensis]|uniref:TrbG/VirB9 family P-type conjugative transfer protein n=1 Tax=Polycladidibacter hongkongensis TaxID=1647556 RepID=UPI00082BEDFF|nr:TrbG/VirB9 family P-type conjugative transfer protein [Pseudovibrio hongkongensis]